MKRLIFGPSGSGKTYLSTAFQKLGINAFDADEIPRLSAWYDKQGQKVATPQSADEALLNQYSFLWSRKYLQKFLSQFPDVYLFGGSGNVFNVFDLFDKVYFLHVPRALREERLRSASRKNPGMDLNFNRVVTWGDWFEEQAKEQEIPFIDASLPPGEVFKLVNL